MQLLGRDARGKAIHQLTPSPKAVARIALPFSQTRHGALKRMRMQIGHARNFKYFAHTDILTSGYNIAMSALSGIKVLELARVLAEPWCGILDADRDIILDQLRQQGLIA